MQLTLLLILDILDAFVAFLFDSSMESKIYYKIGKIPDTSIQLEKQPSIVFYYLNVFIKYYARTPKHVMIYRPRLRLSFNNLLLCWVFYF